MVFLVRDIEPHNITQSFQSIYTHLFFLANLGYDVEYDDTGEEDCDLGSWVHSHKFTGHDNGADGNTLVSSSRHLPSHYYSAVKESVSSLLIHVLVKLVVNDSEDDKRTFIF